MPPRRLPSAVATFLRQRLAVLLRCTRGGPAIEFAFVAPALIALLLAVLHIALIYLAQEGLETAAEAAARSIATGSVTTANTSQTAFKSAVCQQLPPFMSCSRLSVDVTATTGISAAVTSASGLNFSNGAITNTFSYALPTASASIPSVGATQVVVLRLFYLWPVATGPLGFNLTTSGMSNNHLLLATSVLAMEPSS